MTNVSASKNSHPKKGNVNANILGAMVGNASLDVTLYFYFCMSVCQAIMQALLRSGLEGQRAGECSDMWDLSL